MGLYDFVKCHGHNEVGDSDIYAIREETIEYIMNDQSYIKSDLLC